MPSAVDAKKVEATFDNGMLEIKIPKAEEAKLKKIQIQAK